MNVSEVLIRGLVETEGPCPVRRNADKKTNYSTFASPCTVNFANNDCYCGYNDNSRIATEFPCPEQSPIPL